MGADLVVPVDSVVLGVFGSGGTKREGDLVVPVDSVVLAAFGGW